MRIYKRLAMLLSMGIMGIGLITFKFDPAPVASAGQNDTEQVTPTQAPPATPTPSPTPMPTPTPVPNDLTEVRDGDIYELAVNYEKAKLKCDRNEFEGLVTDASYINESDLQFRYATVRDFVDFRCYTKRGSGIIDYVVYCTYRMDIATVETKGISIDRLLITSIDGKPIVFTGFLDDDTQAELDSLHTDDDVQELIGETAEELQTEMEEDPDFRAYMVRLYMGSDLDEDGEEISGDEPDAENTDSSETQE